MHKENIAIISYRCCADDAIASNMFVDGWTYAFYQQNTMNNIAAINYAVTSRKHKAIDGVRNNKVQRRIMNTVSKTVRLNYFTMLHN